VSSFFVKSPLLANGRDTSRHFHQVVQCTNAFWLSEKAQWKYNTEYLGAAHPTLVTAVVLSYSDSRSFINKIHTRVRRVVQTVDALGNRSRYGNLHLNKYQDKIGVSRFGHMRNKS
jgi:hypothetical protein